VGGGVCAESAGCVPPAEHSVDAPPPPVRRVTPVPGETHFGLLEKRLSTPAPKIDYGPKNGANCLKASYPYYNDVNA
jgi:hypothetical protein